MKVYLIEEIIPYENSFIRGIFSTRLHAEDYLKGLPKKIREYSDIIEYTLDEGL